MGLLYLLGPWKLGERRFKRARIQEKRRADGLQIRHEVKHTFTSMVIGTLNAIAIKLLYQAGLTALSTEGCLPRTGQTWCTATSRPKHAAPLRRSRFRRSAGFSQIGAI